MLFNSFAFPVFLVVAFLVYRLIHRWRWPWLAWMLLVSAFFYGCWKPWYLVLIAISTLNSYFFGIAIDKGRSPRRRRLLLVATVSIDLALLGVFKYGNFFLASAELAAAAAGWTLQLPRLTTELPVGISFYTFQTLSYTIDIYRRKIPRARNLLEFSVFVAFFPQLVAGPIVRASTFLPQLRNRPRMDRRALGEGLFLVLAGLAKKMILSDTLKVMVTFPLFSQPQERSAWEVVVGSWATAFQVYCDFSGYTDVAIGAALLFGFRIPLNFNRPFVASSPMELWRRWHISFTSWLRDYLYIPLGGSRGGAWVTSRNLLITFLLAGLWHGAGWQFLVWGIYNGLVLVAWRALAPRPPETRLGRAISTFVNFNLLAFGLIFLHSPTFGQSWALLGSLAHWSTPSSGLLGPFSLTMFALAIFLHLTPLRWKQILREVFAGAPAISLAGVTLIACAVLSLFSGFVRPFFYFQF